MHVVQFRIERGDRVTCTDGPLGHVVQIVVTPDTRQLRALIVREDDSAREVELEASLIVRALMHQVELCIGHGDLSVHPEIASPYDPSHYVPMVEGTGPSNAAAGWASAQTDRAVVTAVEQDAAQLVSARPDLAPEGEVETILTDTTIAGEVIAPPTGQDRIVEPPRVVPTSEGPPSPAAPEGRAASPVPPGGDVMSLEAPPTPVGRQLSQAGKAARPAITAAEVPPRAKLGESAAHAQRIDLPEPIEPFVLTEEALEPLANIAWGVVLAIAAIAAAGIAGLVFWRRRRR
jgi:hypothetical protein